ncbi:MAG: VacJ family lipoprotein [Burkholderiales bacterium]|nr:VacJ family lipoprotein [Burkholderiales bacterium]
MKTALSPSFAINKIANHARWASVAVALALIAGCASGPHANPADPFEPFNRGVTRFNDTVDEAVLVPVATAYQRVLPSMVRTGVGNFFGNLGDVWSFVNSVAQLGVGAGPYVVLPVFGPSTLRDTAALPVDRAGSVLGNMNDVAWRNSLSVLEAVDTRARYLRAGRLLDDAALDKYTFTRDAFLQHRRNDVYDGNPPDDEGGK